MAGDDGRVLGAAQAVAAAAFERLDLGAHDGVHPRFGVVDVVPFVDLCEPHRVTVRSTEARDAFARWAARCGVPCFVYGPECSLPDVRREAFTVRRPDVGPATPHPTAGAIAVGARPTMVAYNLWLATPDLTTARAIAARLRSRSVRALAFRVGDQVQVSCNLVEPWLCGPADVFDAVAERATIARAELVGLIPQEVLARIDPARWHTLDLSPDRTIEMACRSS
jgi:glutamate formiminotransferase